MTSPLSLVEALRGNFVIANLGCSHDSDLNLSDELRSATTLIEIDGNNLSQSNSRYHRHLRLRGVLSDRNGQAPFTVTSYGQTSSLLNPDREKVAAFGLERYFEVVLREEVDCSTLRTLLGPEGPLRIDLLKTDLEGMDFRVIRQVIGDYPDVLAVQCELRFTPLFIGEAPLHEAVGFLYDRGFDVIDMDAGRWRYAVPEEGPHQDGTMVHGDVLLFLRPNIVLGEGMLDRPFVVAKQVVIACLLSHYNYAAYLLRRALPLLPKTWVPFLAALIREGIQQPLVPEIINLAPGVPGVTRISIEQLQSLLAQYQISK